MLERKERNEPKKLCVSTTQDNVSENPLSVRMIDCIQGPRVTFLKLLELNICVDKVIVVILKLGI